MEIFALLFKSYFQSSLADLFKLILRRKENAPDPYH